MFVLFATAAFAGTAIGHPNIHGTPSTLSFTTFELDIAEVQLRRCDLTQVTVELDAVLGEGDPITLPTGCFDRMRIVANGLYAAGTGNGGSFTLDLEPGTIILAVPGDFDSPGSAPAQVVLGGASWVTAEMLGLASGVHRAVEASSSDPLFGPLSEAIRDQSSLAW